ncbi:hypothetical protein SCALIN_C05_0005 [Candidatus Scalindua japonica]|uniref:PIN domain-containing protein n=2 Tax=Candidatus Scalindua japonica TaxID=1284222 RepID=A0A286TVH1_9BACT|nr:PIN domain-containing protein [Candidatus Scalindua japonica]GAX59920.1 hypothetical protein SCALIN_C05_0005 [Candidatus Scalindua japonica]
MIYLDTHIVVWLYSGDIGRLSNLSIALINEHDLFVSPIVILELQYLYEIKRITKKASDVIADLSNRIGLEVCNKDFINIITKATNLKWTRDPFDRIIVSNAALGGDVLVTKDQAMLNNYNNSKW